MSCCISYRNVIKKLKCVHSTYVCCLSVLTNTYVLLQITQVAYILIIIPHISYFNTKLLVFNKVTIIWCSIKKKFYNFYFIFQSVTYNFLSIFCLMYPFAYIYIYMHIHIYTYFYLFIYRETIFIYTNIYLYAFFYPYINMKTNNFKRNKQTKRKIILYHLAYRRDSVVNLIPSNLYFPKNESSTH